MGVLRLSPSRVRHSTPTLWRKDRLGVTGQTREAEALSGCGSGPCPGSCSRLGAIRTRCDIRLCHREHLPPAQQAIWSQEVL